MEKFERNFIYPVLQTFSNFCCRFIDDRFLFWDRSETPLLDFITRLNSRYPTIKFGFRYPKSSMQFLDTIIYKNNENNNTANTMNRYVLVV